MPRPQFLNILSPDGFTISRDEFYINMDKAREAFETWKDRFQAQGYYSSNKGRISLDDLEECCTLVEIPFIEVLNLKKQKFFKSLQR